ncbi:hypothetical protein WH87_01490 [Devosia epidermidihirudinis]|uniref:Type I restriction modification DNA specificity domain-containing protein n=2 Tax=Devosia epidermidihirudinis TaxID=1293439 RepID=A0A0F5QJJ5_9HYPH|nr:hypothetical protein WH87_01490 [Devosia epidermidihirudinis]
MQEFNLLYARGDSIVSLNPTAFKHLGLTAGDVLLVKDSNIGEVAVVPDGDWGKAAFSNGVVRLNIVKDRSYLFGFMKYGSFRRQVNAMTPRGSTIRHAGDRWLAARVPLPQKNVDRAVELISAIVDVTLKAENELIQRSRLIKSTVDNEIREHQLPGAFVPSEPSLSQLLESGRFDAAFHSRECQRDLHLVRNYAHGHESVEDAGFTVIPGPSLEIKIIKQRIDSEVRREGYYQMYIPKNISEYGTMISVPFMGTPANLPLLQRGDVLIGEAGFRKGRSVVFVDSPVRASTNAHGLIARHKHNSIVDAIVFRCVFDWYREQGLIDRLAVGGSGGHFSPSYFPLLLLPKFPPVVRQAIVTAYENCPAIWPPVTKLAEYISGSDEFMKHLGIHQLGVLLRHNRLLLEGAFEDIALGLDLDFESIQRRAFSFGLSTDKVVDQS